MIHGAASRFERTLAEVQRVANLAAELRCRVKELFFLALEQILTILSVVVIVTLVLLRSISARRRARRRGCPAALLVFRPGRLLLLLLMVEEAAEDGIAGQDATRAHRLVDPSRHLEHAVPIASIYDQVEDLRVGQAHALGFQLADDLKELVCAEELLFLVLLPERAAPHVDPAQVHVGALVSPILRDVRVVEPGAAVDLLPRGVHSAAARLVGARLLAVAVAFELGHEVLIERWQDPVVELADLGRGNLRTAETHRAFNRLDMLEWEQGHRDFAALGLGRLLDLSSHLAYSVVALLLLSGAAIV